MKKINVLDKHFAQLIAAGEVVERPASVVKELVENSVDSGATRITTEISHGGVSLIRITDNGSGIYREDVKNAFLRHATSKIKNEKDLQNIASLGFRGEALASVCAVSETEILTKTKDENFGTKFSVVGGEAGETEDAGVSDGTVISVKNLFFNVPARMKFLKKDVTEANLCATVIDKLALSHPEIAFRFINGGKETMRTAGDGKISSAIYGVYGKEFFSGMMPCDYSYENIEISGYISRPAFSKATRNSQNFFVNGRYVKSKLISSALEEAFKNSIMVGKFPYCVLYLKIPFSSVDVNVHPTKTEVKFANEKKVFDAVYYAVKTALMNDSGKMVLSPEPSAQTAAVAKDVPSNSCGVKNFEEEKISEQKVTPKSIFDEKNNFKNFIFGVSKKPADLGLKKEDSRKEPGEGVCGKSETLSSAPVKEPKNIQNAQDEFPQKVQDTDFQGDVKQRQDFSEKEIVQTEFFSEEDEIRVIGEIFDCFIILQRNSEMILIDKHAAHERIIFEKMKSSENHCDSQRLLSPVVVNAEKTEYSAIIENLELFEKIGYIIEDFGAGSVIVREIPMYLDISEINDSVTEIAEYLSSHKKSLDTKKLDWLYDNISCRAAVKAGQKSSTEEIVALVKKLSENPDIQHCPHGRPIFVSLSKKFIEKQFGRI